MIICAKFLISIKMVIGDFLLFEKFMHKYTFFASVPRPLPLSLLQCLPSPPLKLMTPFLCSFLLHPYTYTHTNIEPTKSSQHRPYLHVIRADYLQLKFSWKNKVSQTNEQQLILPPRAAISCNSSSKDGAFWNFFQPCWHVRWYIQLGILLRVYMCDTHFLFKRKHHREVIQVLRLQRYLRNIR